MDEGAEPVMPWRGAESRSFLPQTMTSRNGLNP